MASWIQNQLKAAEDLLQAVDRTAQKVSNLRDRDDRIHPDSGPGSGSRSVGKKPVLPWIWHTTDIILYLLLEINGRLGLVQEDARARLLNFVKLR